MLRGNAVISQVTVIINEALDIRNRESSVREC
ncbi:hypothetical protein BDK88_3699 [Natrinema hispanicum]|uniref:Uncharacterized protein n=1 Tax=Natrinema hispanicum TaxID=392421 RepID=A0A482Y3S9_9EURY|nr:hypothetical protein BDK88_3699 [Natrinema hispanicum]